MDIDLRDWLLILGPVFVTGVLLHGYWRMRRGRGDLKMALDKPYLNTAGQIARPDDLSYLKAELPNGGARVFSEYAQTSVDLALLQLDEDVPVLMESVDIGPLEQVHSDLGNIEENVVTSLEERAETEIDPLFAQPVISETLISQTIASRTIVSESMPAETVVAESVESKHFSESEQPGETEHINKDAGVDQSTVSEPLVAEPSVAESGLADDLGHSLSSKELLSKDLSLIEQPIEAQSSVDERPRAVEKAPPALKSAIVAQAEKFVVVNVQADTIFDGQELLESLVSLGMTFGEMDIFHMEDSEGRQLFSLANSMEPGTFDPATMNQIQARGVVLFMRAHEFPEPVKVYDQMLQVAMRLCGDLGGELQDESRSAMTSQTFEHCRQDILDFQYKHSA